MPPQQRFDIAAGQRRGGLRFRPGMARRFVRIDAAELRDRRGPAGCGVATAAREVRSRLDGTASVDECRQILSGAVGTMGAVESQPDPVQLAIDAMTRSTVKWLSIGSPTRPG